MGAKEIQQVNPGGPDKQPKHQAPTISSIDKSLSRNRHRVGTAITPGLRTKILFDMFHIYCTSVCMQNVSKKY